MGFNVNSSVGRTARSGASLSARRRKPTLMGEINVTPFVDVMMVLLVIFMVAAPLMTVGLKVDLPDAKTPPVEGQDEPIIVSIDKEGKLYLQETEMALEKLTAKLDAIMQSRPDNRIFVQADEALDYGAVMAVVGAISEAGHNKLALITETPKQ